MKKLAENIQFEGASHAQGRIVCNMCNGYELVPLPAAGRGLIDEINKFARKHRHWRSRWSNKRGDHAA